MPADVIDTLVGITEGSPVDLIRRRRPVTRDHAQGSWLALFAPEVLGTFLLKERYAVSLFVVAVSGDSLAEGFYRAGLLGEGGGDWAGALDQAVEAGRTQGPYGRWAHHADLATEGTDGLRYRLGADLRAGLGVRVAAALDHAHLLVFRPREASQADLETLLDAGWSATDVVTLSQLVAFLTFQLRVAAGLRVLKESIR
jgi:CMD domain protein